jgi:transcriptional regulator with XRE-family HTH domain
METMTVIPEATGLGEALRLARVAAGYSQDSLARELRLPVSLLQAIETEQWNRIPPGRERPLARLVARRLGLDLEKHSEAFEALPGGQEQAPPDPKRERLERTLTTVIGLSSMALLAWLVIPGRDLRNRMPTQAQTPASLPSRTGPSVPLPSAAGPYPVLGEVLPEASMTADGILVSLRAMDTCEAKIQGENVDLNHSLRISEPWTVRAKGPFTLSLNNAGVVMVEVAGRRIQHGRSVGEAWSANFDEKGEMQVPAVAVPEAPPPAPDTADEPEKNEEETP